MIYGYVRRSLADTEETIEAQRSVVATVLEDYLFKRSFSTVSRDVKQDLIEDFEKAWTVSLPKFSDLLERIESGDTIIIAQPEKVAASVRAFYDLVRDLTERGVTLVVAQPRIFNNAFEAPVIAPIVFDPGQSTTETPMRMLEAMAGFETSVAAERLMTAKALKSPRKGGRNAALSDEQVATLKQMVNDKASQVKIAKTLQVSQSTVSRYISDLFKEGRKPNAPYLEDPTVRRIKRKEYEAKRSKNKSADETN